MAEKIAEIRGLETAVFAAQTTENAERLFCGNKRVKMIECQH
ncbi:MAG: TatD family hydrolase [Chloroflexi bacterium]|nr:TatD family hydrolase [Chloroflexota bacterium]